MKLYSYFRSSAAFRVRIVLNIKNIPYQILPIHLLKEGGQQKLPKYHQVNPQQLVPALELDHGTILTQSLAIIEYLDEVYPTPPVLPRKPLERAYTRAIASQIACDIHPLNNLRVLKYLEENILQTKETINKWYQHWIQKGLRPLEEIIRKSSYKGRYCCGDHITMADICLVPQLFNARRFNCVLDDYPTLLAIEQECLKSPHVIRALPQNQPDAE